MSWLGSFFSSSNTNSGNDFIGQLVELGDYKVQVKKVIAEGLKTLFLLQLLILITNDSQCTISPTILLYIWDKDWENTDCQFFDFKKFYSW